MFKVLERLTEARRSIERSEMMQRLERAGSSIRSNAIVKQLALAPRSPGRRLFTAFLIALTATTAALFAATCAPLNDPVANIDNAIYDTSFHRRTPESHFDDKNVVIIAVDDRSVEMARKEANISWPWPRENWAALLQWLQQCHVRAVVFDIFFEDRLDDAGDLEFAKALDSASIPIVIAQREVGATFWPPVKRAPTFGAVKITDAVIRQYAPSVDGVPTLAIQTLCSIGKPVPAWAAQSFRLHFYGPTRTAFQQLPAYDAILAAAGNESALAKIKPEFFADRIVIIGATANATNDIKSSPVDKLYPGTEAQATALTNLLENRHVRVVPLWITCSVAFFASMFATTGTILPKQTWLKLLMPVTGLAGVFILGYLLFVPFYNISWLPLAMPLLATGLAALGGISWTYFVEDRQRRVLRKFLAQYVSPSVAQKLDDIGTVSLGGVQRELTLLFSDIAGFTTLSEQMESDQLEKFMNFYLSQMSDVVFQFNGTLDKYIGDAVMAFWNAPLDQVDHAVLACRTALKMHQREEEIRPILAEMGAGDTYTRIGVNTGLVKVGNYGSMQKLNYTAIGDSVNLASRLEGANKIYGSRILVAQPTVDLVGNRFLFRKLDLLKVKGKDRPMAVYELLAEGTGTSAQQNLARESESALHAYQQRNWDEAERMLVVLSQSFPDDGPTESLLHRVRDFRKEPPPSDWDGAYIAKSK
jgi:adenylate cyclase